MNDDTLYASQCTGNIELVCATEQAQDRWQIRGHERLKGVAQTSASCQEIQGCTAQSRPFGDEL